MACRHRGASGRVRCCMDGGSGTSPQRRHLFGEGRGGGGTAQLVCEIGGERVRPGFPEGEGEGNRVGRGYDTSSRGPRWKPVQGGSREGGGDLTWAPRRETGSSPRRREGRNGEYSGGDGGIPVPLPWRTNGSVQGETSLGLPDPSNRI